MLYLHADMANERLRRRFYKMTLNKGINRNVATTAIARELLACFMGNGNRKHFIDMVSRYLSQGCFCTALRQASVTETSKYHKRKLTDKTDFIRFYLQTKLINTGCRGRALEHSKV